MASKAVLVLGVLLAVFLVISSEVAAREVAENSNEENTNTASESVDGYKDGGCKHRCCYYYGHVCRRCCSYAGEVPDAETEAEPKN